MNSLSKIIAPGLAPRVLRFRRARFSMAAVGFGLTMLLLSPSPAWPTNAGTTRLLVKFAPGTSTQTRGAALALTGATEQRLIPHLGIRLITVPSTRVTGALDKLQASPLVEFAERDGLARPQELLPRDPSFPQSYALGGGAWGWYTTHTTQAWDITEGDPSAVVAVLDTGLKPKGLSDFDGQVVTGWNVLDNSTDTTTNAGNHGTYVSGVVGLAVDNDSGNAGFCPKCKIMPVQVGTDSGAYDSDLASGITWAADHGARVENLSWAGPSSSSTLANAVAYARSKGVVVVAAAGNANCNCVSYPAAIPGVLGVAGTDSTDAKAGDSNYGTWVALAAPEGNMTAWPAINGTPGYAPVGGTSLAAPVVAGIAGLLFSADHSLTGGQVEQALEQSALPVGFSVAHGRVDALAALNYLGFYDPQPASAPVNTSPPEVRLETNGAWNSLPLTGPPQVAQVLVRGQGSWTGSAPLSLSSVRWQRCDPTGLSCTTVATAAAYTVQAADSGYSLRVVITVKNGLGLTTLASPLSLPVGGGVSTAPANTALPTVSGSAVDGQRLTAAAGSWSGSPTTYAYQWLRCDATGAACTAVTGAAGSSYSIGWADVDATLRVQVTATNAAGSSSATSVPTAQVAGLAPANTTLPSVSGSPVAGQTLTTGTGSWVGTAPLSYAYRWQRCTSAADGATCTDIAGGAGATYVLTSSDIGNYLRAGVAATNSCSSGCGSSISFSAPTAAIVSAAAPTTQSFSFSGSLSRNVTSQSFTVAIGAGEADATLTFSKAGSIMLQLVDATGAVVARADGMSLPVSLNVPNLAAGTYRYLVSASSTKGAVSFTLTGTVPSP